MRRNVVAAFAAVGVALVSLAAACGDDDAAPQPGPRVDLIADALDAVADDRGATPELLEVSANGTEVEVIVRDSGSEAVLYRYDGDLTGPVEPRVDERDAFMPDAVRVDPDHVFDGVRSQLPDAEIVDLAVHVDGGAVVIDATIASDAGGLLLVLLDGRGQVLGTMPL
jgi:hypothetical protein